MKKYLLLLVIILFLSGCSSNNENVMNNEITNDSKDDYKSVEVYEDDNPIEIGLYNKGKLVNEYNTKFVNGVDIGSFDVYFTNEEDVGSSNTKYNFNRFYKDYENIDNYKIGFFVSFDANNKHYEKVVLDPDVEFALAPYVYIYLYDDIHVPDGSWYSHITKDEYNDDTVFSSIKLYMAERSDEMESDITLSVFTYDDILDFDSNGYYRGKSIHTIIIKNG